MPRIQEQLIVYVPTRGRARKQTTLKQFDLYKRPDVFVVVPECERRLWTRDVLVVPDDYKFSDIRQFILNCPGKYHLVLDDDLRPAVRRIDDPTKFTNLEVMDRASRADHIDQLFDTILSLLQEGWVHGGIAARQGANNDTNQYQFCSRVVRAHFYNAEIVKSLGHDFRQFVIKQDYDFILSMLCKGIPNIVINEYVQDQVGSNTSGGCSRYRTSSVLEEGANLLHQKYPDFVKVVHKHPKTSWGGKPRVDVVIQWKKAYKEGLEYARHLQRKNPASMDNKDRAIARLQPLMQVLSNKLLEGNQPK